MGEIAAPLFSIDMVGTKECPQFGTVRYVPGISCKSGIKYVKREKKARK
jgi:hypothetical protein